MKTSRDHHATIIYSCDLCRGLCFFVFLFFCFCFCFFFVYLVSFFRFHYLDVVASRERRWESRRNGFSKFASQIITVPS